MYVMSRSACLLLALAVAGCNLTNTADTPTLPAAVTVDAPTATAMADDPTQAAFDLDADAGLSTVSAQDAAAAVAPGEFRVTVSGDTRLTFDSAGSGASAALVDQGDAAILRFRLGPDASSLFAQEISVMIPADIQPGEFLLQGSFGLDALTGNSADEGVPMSGRVTISEVSASSISGELEFTATTGSAQPTVVTATFRQIPKVTE